MLRARVKTQTQEVRTETVQSLEVGEYAMAVDKHGSHHLILRHYAGFVDLHNPMATWTSNEGYDGPLFEIVRKLEPGDTLILE